MSQDMVGLGVYISVIDGKDISQMMQIDYFKCSFNFLSMET